MANLEEKFITKIWDEIPEPDNPFAAARCYCYGYDVFGDLLENASWIEYLYLLFKGERPSQQQAKLLEGIGIALANPGIREPSVHAAMSGGAGGSTSASCLMAALAVGAGQLGGAHEVYRIMEYWQQCKCDLDAWRELLLHPSKEERFDIWLPMEHPPGFDPYGASCTTPVKQTLNHLAKLSPKEHLRWLEAQRHMLESAVGLPLAMSSVSAAAFIDLDLTPQQGEMLYLLLRLPGAAAHALEQQDSGWRYFPLFAKAIKLTDDPSLIVSQTPSESSSS
jgi:citrate synthase